ncbi:recombinase family protein [Pseudorhodobacter sp.]|uniref:recombinase family protein n=1 Tax=Pseudorhodobacter sp. TaxID=1934400 RepID=UPI002AFDE6FD|nr:recombinase family protein [Pseudorhodobacter sp.]
MMSELIQPTHLKRKAVVYIRQSTPHQVVNNQESLRLQYALRERACELGWHEADIDVIDADLGLSGASAALRSGFKELVGRVGLSEVGLILSIDVTRLARNCSDWYPLLDICGLRECLIADRDGVYDPGSANGRLLLGLKGTISELELHTIRSRLTAGLIAKAKRGELALTLPVGLKRDPSGVVLKDPNLAVQERLSLVFGLFLKVRTIAKVMRTLNGRGLDLPRQDRHGDLHWTRATVSAVSCILKNPAYAGAFVYGRTRIRAAARDDRSSVKVARPIDEWRIVVKDRYPAYIDWPTYEKIRNIVSDNRAEYMRTKTRGAPRDGELLLHGIAWCARCGHKMYVRYKGGGEYVCNHLRLPFRIAHVPARKSRARRRCCVWRVPERIGTCRTRCPVARAPGPESESTRRCAKMPNATSSVPDMLQLWRNDSSIVSIRITVLSQPNSSVVGRAR